MFLVGLSGCSPKHLLLLQGERTGILLLACLNLDAATCLALANEM